MSGKSKAYCSKEFLNNCEYINELKKQIEEANKIFETVEHPTSDMALASDLQWANYYRNQLCLIHRILNPINASVSQEQKGEK